MLQELRGYLFPLKAALEAQIETALSSALQISLTSTYMRYCLFLSEQRDVGTPTPPYTYRVLVQRPNK